MSLTKEQKLAIIEDNQQAANDTGSPQVQIAILTAEITYLTDHLNTHKKDNGSRRGLLKKVAARRSLLDYYRKGDEQGYQDLIKKLGIRR
jgi:small subunit ribosomal protein S15